MTTQNTNARPEFKPAFDAYEPTLCEAIEACEMFAQALSTDQPTIKGRYNATEAPIGAILADLVDIRLAPYWLTLSGVNGCGKTFLANQLGQHAQRVSPYASAPYERDKTDDNDRRPRVVWFDEVNFVKRCRDGEYDLPEYLGRDWLVIIDDLGASRDKTGFAGDMLFRLCNARIGKFTMFTTNLDLPNIANRIDARITSRLIRDGNTFIRIEAGDYALRA